MRMNLTNEQLVRLINFCNSSKCEQAFTIAVDINGEDISFVNLSPARSRDIAESTPRHIIYDNTNYLTSAVYEIFMSKNGYYFSGHTHPGYRGSTKLSQSDISCLISLQELANRIAVDRKKTDAPVIAVETIINSSDVSFYTYDTRTQRVIRLPLFIDGIERIPLHEKSPYQTLRDGFEEGRKRAR